LTDCDIDRLKEVDVAAGSKTVLITGGAGFIGANLADRLLTRGCHVTILDDFSRPGIERNVSWLRGLHGESVDVMTGSVTDPATCGEAVGQAEVVYHLAGQTAVTTSVADPRRDFEINALGAFNVLEAARHAGHSPIVVYSSTNKVYGEMEDVATVEESHRYVYTDLPNGVAETHPLDFHSPYGCSKGAADQYIHDYARIYGIPTVVFRQSCIYGPRQMGVEDQGWLAWFVIALVTGRPITIYGNGKQVRDVLYIDDLLDAFELAVDRIEVTRGEVYNIGGGIGNAISIWWDFKPLIESILERHIPNPTFDSTRPGDQPIFVADVSKATRDFGWSPRVTAGDGLARLAEWVIANRDLFAQ
jgi:CDP-paratose 2-epimerase